MGLKFTPTTEVTTDSSTNRLQFWGWSGSNATGTQYFCDGAFYYRVYDTPATPTGLVGTPHDGRVQLNWDSVAGASGYVIKRNGTEVGRATGQLFFYDAGLTNGTSYSYSIAAYNEVATGSYTTSVNVTPAEETGGGGGGMTDEQIIKIIAIVATFAIGAVIVYQFRWRP
jgi:hypothetical protein